MSWSATRECRTLPGAHGSMRAGAPPCGALATAAPAQPRARCRRGCAVRASCRWRGLRQPRAARWPVQADEAEPEAGLQLVQERQWVRLLWKRSLPLPARLRSMRRQRHALAW